MSDDFPHKAGQRRRVESPVHKEAALLEGINRVLREALVCRTDEQVARACLAVAEELTDSAFGFIGEVNDAGRFDTIALSDPGWDACRMPKGDAIRLIKDMEIRGIWGQVIRRRESLIANDPASHPERVGIPEGHPAVLSFLGVPLKQEERTIGMIAVANKEAGYDAADREALETLSVAFAEALMRKRAEVALREHREHLAELVKLRTEELARRNDELRREIAERRRVEEALRREEEHFRALTESTSDWIWEVDENGVYTYASPKVRDILGYEPEEVIGKTPFDIMPEDEAQRVAEEFREVAAAAKPFAGLENTNRRKDGRLVVLESSGVPMFDADGRLRGYRGIDRDVTARKLTEVALRESEERFRSLAENAYDAISIMDYDVKTRKRRLVYCNDRYVEMSGYTRQQLEGVDDIAQLQITSGAEDDRLFDRLLEEGLPSRGTGSWRRPDGRENVFEWTGVRFEAGGKVRVIGIDRDITDQRRTEAKLNATLEELKRSNRELEQFAYVASHDLQEPLRTVTSFIQLLKQRYEGRLDSDADEFIGFVVDGVGRMRQLINDLLTYSRVQTRGGEFAPTDSGAVMEQTLVDLKAGIVDSGAVVTCDPLPTVLADVAQLRQLFQNLVGNAIKFRGQQPPRVHVSAEPRGDEWVFSVRDNGIGIASQYNERIFQIFQRLHTRSEYKGTGIGLAVCRRIVERHGGRIWVESEPGKGSSFFFTLPNRAATRHGERKTG